MDLKIGCTGWSYQGWIGPFYPKAMKETEYLKHYSSIFDITEINSTFYRIPTQSMTSKWFSDTPQNFIFTAKLPKIITHDNRLRPGPYLDQFINSIKPLESKMKILVIQLPPSLSFAEAKPNLEKMVNHLPKNYRYAVEGRHPSWFTEESCKYLGDKNLCLVWNEVEGVSNPAPVTTDFVYLRLIGDRSIPESEFGKIQKDQSHLMEKWAEKLDSVKNQVLLAVAMANNHFEGFAPVTANKLRVLMGLSYVTWTDTKQRSLSDFSNQS
ncbi:MAG: DUF72 domain-containing protein [Nitrosotalea sp.]